MRGTYGAFMSRMSRLLVPCAVAITLPVLAASRRVVVFARGREKADAVRAALAEPTSGLPVALLARAASAVSFLLDADAASRL